MTKAFIAFFPSYLLYLLVHHVTIWVMKNGWNFKEYGGWGFAFLWMLEVLAAQIVASMLLVIVLKVRKSHSFALTKQLIIYAILFSLLIIGLEMTLPKISI